MKELFVREIPNSVKYTSRYELEYGWVRGTIAEEYMKVVFNICQHAKHIPHIIRGSAGSSYLCYLLGISDVDPVHWDVKPERFYHPKRDDIPDIDLDFPHSRRDEVFDIIHKLYPEKSARISNHTTYHEKSAVREAVRRLGYRKLLPRKFALSNVVPGNEQRAIEIADELMGSVKEVSLHCGGVVVFKGQIDSQLLSVNGPNQVILDKREIENKRMFKIDILSSNSLSQLLECDQRPLDQYPQEDELTSTMLSSGGSLGITQAESPAFQKMLRAIKPKGLADIVMCMALIRPASAWRAHRKEFVEQWEKKRSHDLMVFEDDATEVIKSLTGLDGPGADALRRAFMKKNDALTKGFREKVSGIEGGETIIKDIEAFRTFSMCKAHSVSYAYVTWALAYNKAHNPKQFWLSTLNNSQSMWRRWVHVEEAKRAGWEVMPGSGSYKKSGDILHTDDSQRHLFKPDQWWELRHTGSWSGNKFPGGTFFFNEDEKVSLRGIVGTYRIIKKHKGDAITFATVGTSQGQYYDLVIDGAVDLRDVLSISGTGEAYSVFGSEAVKLDRYKLHTS